MGLLQLADVHALTNVKKCVVMCQFIFMIEQEANYC